ncbi:hypothetical protein AAMO2058_000271400 [Amorphochlora amoebiformis]
MSREANSRGEWQTTAYGGKRGRSRSPPRSNRRPPRSDSPCYEWNKTGRCRFGDSCKFFHEANILALEHGLGARRRPPMGAPGGGVCYEFRDFASCRFGADCKFIHEATHARYSRYPPSDYYGGGVSGMRGRYEPGREEKYSRDRRRSRSRDRDRDRDRERERDRNRDRVLYDRRARRRSYSPRPRAAPANGYGSAAAGSIDEICYMFRDTGSCKFGSRCKFQHISEGGSNGHGRGGPREGERREKRYDRAENRRFDRGPDGVDKGAIEKRYEDSQVDPRRSERNQHTGYRDNDVLPQESFEPKNGYERTLADEKENRSTDRL